MHEKLTCGPVWCHTSLDQCSLDDLVITVGSNWCIWRLRTEGVTRISLQHVPVTQGPGAARTHDIASQQRTTELNPSHC